MRLLSSIIQKYKSNNKNSKVVVQVVVGKNKGTLRIWKVPILLGFSRFLLIKTLHRREQQYISNGLAVGKQHNQSVDAVADTTSRRHTDAEGI